MINNFLNHSLPIDASLRLGIKKVNVERKIIYVTCFTLNELKVI